MSEQKLVSPLLDGFRMGDPISSHDGVRCCPAIKENSDNKYIIKILSIPASQNQLEALLLTGAFQDAAGALNYFKELADGVVREAQLHQQLAKLDGFAPCEAWQVVPMDDNQLGYDVYLLTGYQRTLERHLRQNPMTHLQAVNLGLDLCAALAACRRAGYIYVDLKPSNIFISADKEYLIGDLGFISMDSLKYAALPSKYRSCYSAPEMHDVFATISDTADIYALGLILYQIYNDGQLPFDSQPTDQELPAPANADAEMAEIILKACAPDPADRWQDPAQMGQALVAYMQRNGVNDDPIVPPAVEEESAEEEAPAEEAPVEEAPVEEVPAEEIPVEEAAPVEEEAPVEETAQEEELPAAEEAAETEAPAEEEVPAAEEEPAEQPADEEAPVDEETPAEEEMPAVDEEPAEEEAPAAAETEAAEEAPAAEAADEGEPDEASELAAIYDMVADEPAPDEETAEDVEIENLSEEISAILAQADELVAHEIPEPVVVPEATLPEEEPEPEPVSEEVPAEPQPESDEDDEDDGEDEVDIPIAIPDLTPVKKRGKKLLVTLIILALLAGLGYGANHYYWNYYLVPVESIVLDGGIDEITAQVDVAMDESILTAVCTDTYGNTTTSPVENGQARFTNLKPGTQYTVTLKIDGFYKLSGNNAASFTTGQQTNIVSISATTGAEDGSVILSFTVDGTDPKDWTVEYGTEGEETQSLSFTGHMVTITGLTVDSTYTFRLMPTQETDVDLVGTDTLEFTVSGVVLAQNVTIASFEEDVLTLRWDAPEGVQVSEWTVRCTSTEDESYDETLLVSEATAQFSGIEAGKPYTLEILAEGMTQSVRTDISAQPLAITDVTATLVNAGTLRITWEYQGDAPAEGWTVSYSIDGSTAKTLESESNAADLTTVVPGASYEITVQPTGELTGVSTTYESPAADKFSGHGLTSGDLSHSLCLTPDVSGWDYNNVEQYTSTFSPSQSVSMVVYSKVSVAADSADTHVLYVVRDADGKICLASGQTMNWKNMWKERYFYPTLPETPDEAGRYTFEVYFDGALAVSKNFTIS